MTTQFTLQSFASKAILTAAMGLVGLAFAATSSPAFAREASESGRHGADDAVVSTAGDDDGTPDQGTGDVPSGTDDPRGRGRGGDDGPNHR